MLNIVINMSTIALILAVGIIGFICGLVVRLAINSKLKRKVESLENEMVLNHAEILKLTEELVQQKKGTEKTDVPVITIAAQAMKSSSN